MTTYEATHKGQTYTRNSKRAYAFASVVRWRDGDESVASWHATRPLAERGTLTAQQRQAGAQIVAVVNVKVVQR